jgi:hypothetical protein
MGDDGRVLDDEVGLSDSAAAGDAVEPCIGFCAWSCRLRSILSFKFLAFAMGDDDSIGDDNFCGIV